METWLTATGIVTNGLLVAVGIYLANNLRRQLRLRIVDRQLESYTGLWALMEVSGPWRLETGFDPMSPQERRLLYDSMTDWYFGSGGGMFLGGETKELYLNAKYNLICADADLRPPTISGRVPADPQVRERWRGSLSMSQLSLLRAQMRYDLAIYGLRYKTEPLNEEETAFLRDADIDPRKKPWKSSRRVPGKDTVRGFESDIRV
jgi:hypothetical protein